MKKIQMPVTPEGNDPADYTDEALAEMDTEIQKAKAPAISRREAEEYIKLYEALKAKAMTRGADQIKCRVSNERYQLCLAVLGKSD